MIAHKDPCESDQCYQFLCVDARLEKWKRELGPQVADSTPVEVPAQAASTGPTFQKMVAMTTEDRKKNLLAAASLLDSAGKALTGDQLTTLAEFMEVYL